MSKEMKNIRASETALGVIPLGAETKAQAQLRGAWERRLAPLGLALPDQAPPDDMWFRIRSALDRKDDKQALAKTKRGIWRWRWLSLLLAGLSAALIAFIAMKGIGSNKAEGTGTGDAATLSASKDGENTSASNVVAVATPDGSKQALILELDTEAETARIRPVGVTVEEDRDLEMWRITPQDPPASLGLVAPDQETTIPLKINAGDTIAITLEPKDGSTTGAPSGPTVFSAPFIEISE